MAAPALLFDLDGTLCDSHPWYASVLGTLAEEPEERFLELIRGGRPAIVIARDMGFSRSRFLRACERATGSLAAFAGVRQTLEMLDGRNVPLGVVTTVPPSLADVVLEGLEISDVLDAVVGAEWGLPRKPHPAPLLKALDQLNLKPNPEIFYVGDHANDRLAAKQAGLSFAWARFGYQIDIPQDPDTVLDAFADVLRL